MRKTRPSLHLWVTLARAYRAIEARAAEDVARHGLTLAEFGVLEALYHLGPLSLGELQRKVLVSSGGITWLADGLERRGLIRRAPSERDRRVRIASLTGEGRALIERIFPGHAACLVEATDGLTDDERETAATLLRRLGRQAAGTWNRER
jgi:MarR family 2-MHQ and catechol resistance regulon transcriptional repressor